MFVGSFHMHGEEIVPEADDPAELVMNMIFLEQIDISFLGHFVKISL